MPRLLLGSAASGIAVTVVPPGSAALGPAAICRRCPSQAGPPPPPPLGSGSCRRSQAGVLFWPGRLLAPRVVRAPEEKFGVQPRTEHNKETARPARLGLQRAEKESFLWAEGAGILPAPGGDLSPSTLGPRGAVFQAAVEVPERRASLGVSRLEAKGEGFRVDSRGIKGPPAARSA